MRYRLRTLLLLLAIGPPLLAGVWLATLKAIADYRARQPLVLQPSLEDWQQLTIRGSRHAKRHYQALLKHESGLMKELETENDDCARRSHDSERTAEPNP